MLSDEYLIAQNGIELAQLNMDAAVKRGIDQTTEEWHVLVCSLILATRITLEARSRC